MPILKNVLERLPLYQSKLFMETEHESKKFKLVIEMLIPVQ